MGADSSENVAFELNGQRVRASARRDQTLLDFLRNTLGLKATRLGCGLAQCGACNVLVDGVATAACDTPLRTLSARRVTTLEGLGSRDRPHPLQTAFVELQAMQCGYCTSGMIMSAAALLARDPDPSPDAIRAALDGNLCRCGVHNRIVEAVRLAASSR